MDTIAKIRHRARRQSKTIVLPEGHDERIRRAAEFIAQEKIANVIVLERGKLDPKRVEEYTESYFQARQSKGITREEAMHAASNPVFYGAMMVRDGLADGFVAGAATTTADVARAGFYCVGLDKKVSTLSSCFIMTIPGSSFGASGTFLFADCGVIPEPTSRQLAQIAICTADLARKVLDITPRVAMLSYSTKGSASGRFIDKVKEALIQVKELVPELIVDGELQVDAAIVPEVGRYKNPTGAIQGDANVLVFPNLEAGNISYKLVERLAGGRALGPLLLGLNKPCSDLSRGCSWEDVVDCVAVTAIRAQDIS